MKLHTVFISYNRLDLTKRAIESYLDTISVPFSLCVVDNGSDDKTQEFLLSWIHEGFGWPVLLLGENRYPGYACNRGFELAPDDASFLHRADNDFVFLSNWCAHVEHKFRNSKTGQVGLRTNEEEHFAQSNVGGNMVLRRELWDAGLRYDETPWPDLPPGYSEDSFLSPAVSDMGWRWTRVNKSCIKSISKEDPTDPYYIQSWTDRRIHADLLHRDEAQ